MPKVEIVAPAVSMGAAAHYTVSDTPEIVARIESDLARIVETVRASDPALRSLVLTGGFARGEGTVLDGAPQNDYDLVAVRAFGRSRRPYRDLVHELEGRLGLHIDLAPVGIWRLSWVSPSIFWYETALRGRIIWGEDVLHRIPVRDPAVIEPREALRLLANRAAGLLLVTRKRDDHAYRIQAAKALLAVKDVHLMARGRFPPSQRERWDEYRRLGDRLPTSLTRHGPYLEWAFRFKTEPGGAAHQDAMAAWNAARGALLDAIPVALAHAGVPSLMDALLRDTALDRLFYQSRAHTLPGARRRVRHATGAVRLATLRMLADARDASVDPGRAREHLAPLYAGPLAPLDALERLRAITLV